MKYFDFRKVLDCVHHLRLVHQLNELGISNRLHNWVQGFFTKQMLRVKVGEGYSKRIDVRREAAQGSVLGPILALRCINDCSKGLTTDAVMFADGVGT